MRRLRRHISDIPSIGNLRSEREESERKVVEETGDYKQYYTRKREEGTGGQTA